MNSRSEITMNGIKTRKSRPNASRGGRNMRGSGVEKTVFQNEGVYSNPRLTHVATSLVGCVVLVEVKNGGQYEGVLRTFSSKMDVVLDMAHKVDETCQNSVPSKDRIIDTVIFHLSDIVAITALGVDLDYATKDAFTDTAISGKFNGQAGEKELQPWDGEMSGEGGLEAIESPSTTTDNSNGWDPNEMFKTNRDRFDVKSSYDPSLSQYTTPLKQENTSEYKKREAMAAKLAQEIEKSDSYKRAISLEVGDGDEEDKFSAVVRPGEQGGPAGNLPNRYVPPHLRKNPQQGRATRSTPQGIPGSGRSSVSSVTSPQPSPTQHVAPVEFDSNINGDKDDAFESDKVGQLMTDGETGSATQQKETTPPVVVKSDDRKSAPTGHSRDAQIKELKQFSTDFKLSQTEKEKRISPAPSQHLASPSSTTPSSAESVSSMTQPSSSSQRASPATPTAPTSTPPLSTEDKSEKKEDDKLTETLKKSTLNPNAKEFVFNPNAKPFQPKQPMQVATPPRPATQSPGMVQQMPPSMQGQPLYPPYQVIPVSVTQNVVQQPQQQRFDLHRKRAVVSVQPRADFNAQAAAATGQPLLAQPTAIQQTPQYTVQYMPPNLGQPQNMPQMVPMPPTTMTGTRMMAPPGAGQQHMEQGMQQTQGGQNTIFVSPPGAASAVQAAAAAAAHLGPPPGGAGQPHSHQNPTHMAPHHQPTPPHSQPSQHMNSQGGGGGHPAPSPVQHPVGPGHPPPPQQGGQQVHSHPGAGQGHPGSSGTPQPHLIYQQHAVQMSQQGHPPLQPSPHTPTSPQTMYPQTFVASPYYATSQAPGMPQQQQNQQQPPGGGPQMSFTHTQPHTTVTHAHHHQHSHIPHHGGGNATQAPTQIVMMPQHPHQSHQQALAGAAGQMQHVQHPQLQHTHQIPHHMAGMQAAAAGQAGHLIQQQAMGVSNNMQHAQMHYQMHPHHPMQQPGPGQGYQHNQ